MFWHGPDSFNTNDKRLNLVLLRLLSKSVTTDCSKNALAFPVIQLAVIAAPSLLFGGVRNMLFSAA